MRQMVLALRAYGELLAPEPLASSACPVRRWQLWNEQSTPWNWAQGRWAPDYVNLLKAVIPARFTLPTRGRR